jgi:hypothetical protein
VPTVDAADTGRGVGAVQGTSPASHDDRQRGTGGEPKLGAGVTAETTERKAKHVTALGAEHVEAGPAEARRDGERARPSPPLCEEAVRG